MRVAALCLLLATPVAAQAPPGGWPAAIDATWGPGASVEEHLGVFDAIWARADTAYAAFGRLGVDWDAQRARYRPEIAAGVSAGRFAAILNHLALSLQETHSYAVSRTVNATRPALGIPLLYPAVWGENGHFGACLSPLPDRTLIVYAVAENHPLGLIPGDIVTGYDGRAWAELYPELLAAELPLYRRPYAADDPRAEGQALWGTSPSAFAHSWLIAAGLNWHLFHGLDVVHASGEAERLSVAPLAGAAMQIQCHEQMPVPGVPFPVPTSLSGGPPAGRGEDVSWGVIAGTRVGYIYVRSWFSPATRLDFGAAVTALALDPAIEGLIVDTRSNEGGWPDHASEGLAVLFDDTHETLEMVWRTGPADRLALRLAPPFAGPLAIVGDPATVFDRPLAILTGPGAVSAGDFNALRLRVHPRARAFGKPTNGAFTPATAATLPLGASERYDNAISFANAQRVDAPGAYLVGSEQVPDEDVWLEQADVLRGEDTVVRHALEWISASVADEPGPPAGARLTLAPNPARTVTTVAFGRIHAAARLVVVDALGRTVYAAGVPAGTEALRLDVRPLAPGVYTALLSADDDRQAVRFTVVR